MEGFAKLKKNEQPVEATNAAECLCHTIRAIHSLWLHTGVIIMSCQNKLLDAQTGFANLWPPDFGPAT